MLIETTLALMLQCETKRATEKDTKAEVARVCRGKFEVSDEDERRREREFERNFRLLLDEVQRQAR